MATSTSIAHETLLQTLTTRGWCFGETDEVKAVIAIQSALHDESLTVDLIESELSNLDLRSVGGPSLPDPSVLRKASHLQAPKVLQIASVRDISRSIAAESLGNSNNHRRLLRLKLTDGHSEITAIEYSPIPSIPDNVVPGTKVLLKNKAMIRSGIVCLDAKVITILGGVVQSLYEEWQMNQKYGGFSRSSRLSQETEAGGPPPFEKLKIVASSQMSVQQGKFSQKTVLSSKSYRPTHTEKGKSYEYEERGKVDNRDSKVDRKSENAKSDAQNACIEEKPTSSESRPKEAESIPVHNQVAAQKLFQKMSQPNRDDRHSRGQRHRGKGKQEESPVLTLDEWERRKAGVNLVMREELPNQDEELALQLQRQFDLEDIQVQKGPHVTEAEDIRMSMFNFERGDARALDRTDFRGRGRGRERRGRGWRG
ncbi:unnamed protein product [Ilex paraguariensis]|uniref:RecQ mediated genome instability protein 1 OB-fold domain-containing protein n=1 Tax=Ilex paraguariensis TaxID=185542 RepID=A0ABC8SB99_9AQUA